MITQEYRRNRARFPRSEILRYQGCWVAFSGDGLDIVASGESVERVEEQLIATGQDPQRIVLEYLPGPEEDSLLGAGESI